MSDNFTPTIKAIVDAVRARIVDGTYRVGTSLPSEHEIASQLRVSRGSVRKGIETLIGSGELERQRYSRPIVARRLSRVPSEEQTDVYVWLAQSIRDDTSLPFLQGVSHELAGTPYRMVVREPSVFSGDVVREDEKQFLVDLQRKPHVAGAIIWRNAWGDHSVEVVELLKRGMPLVFVDSKPPGGLEVDFVGTANVAAAKRCVRHLLDLGHRRIVCVTDSDVPTAISDRIQGFWRAMRQAGLDSGAGTDLFAKCVMPGSEPGTKPLEDHLGGVYGRFLASNKFYSDLAHGLVAQFLALDPRPTALFVTYDVLAAWVCAVLEGHGVRVPQDVSVVGFDWRARWDKSLADVLDTASQDFEGFGRHAVELLLDRFAGGTGAAPRCVLLDAPLVVRSSTTTHQLSRPKPSLATTASV